MIEYKYFFFIINVIISHHHLGKRIKSEEFISEKKRSSVNT